MSIVLARIDNRLLHGVVATQWTPFSKCTRLMIIDDKTANDPILKEGMKLARPVGVSVSIITEETAITNFRANKYDGQRVFILTEKPATLVKLLEAGAEIPKVNIGGTVLMENGLKLSSRAMASQEDIAAYKKIAAQNIPITIQYVPSDSEVAFSSVVDTK